MLKARDTLVDYLIITFGAAVCAAAVFFFLIPSHLLVGSVSGLAILLNSFLPLPISVITFLLNMGLLLLGLLLIGRDFGAKTLYTSVMIPGVMGLLEVLFPGQPSVMGDPFQDMICYLFLVSVGQAILFVRNASSGGLDIVGKLLNKFFRIELGQAVALAGTCVALSSALLYDARTVVLSVLGTYLGGIVLDHFLFGFDQKRRICVLSDRIEELRDYVLNQLHSGATIYEAIGAYDRKPHRELVVIVDRHEYTALRAYIERLDPKAFLTVSAVSEVSYQPKPGRR